MTYSDKSLLAGDEAAELVVRYASALSNNGLSDTVTLNCIGADGNSVEAIFLLGGGAPLMVESTESEVPEPDNSAAVSYMRAQIERVSQNIQAGADSHEWDLDERATDHD